MKMKIVAVVAVLLGAAAGFASDPPTGVQLSCCDFGDGICLGEYGTCATCGMRM